MVPGMNSTLIICIMRFIFLILSGISAYILHAASSSKLPLHRFILFYGRTYPFTFLFEQVLLQSKLLKTRLPLLICPSLLLLQFPLSGIERSSCLRNRHAAVGTIRCLCKIFCKDFHHLISGGSSRLRDIVSTGITVFADTTQKHGQITKADRQFLPIQLIPQIIGFLFGIKIAFQIKLLLSNRKL